MSNTEDHYASCLPPWRYMIRQAIIPLIRRETVCLAQLQAMLRRPFLDHYFAISANLGTHTFYMLSLPILFWCDYGTVGRAFVHMLALGVCASGLIKDLLCLPRPSSPPLQRITMSGYVSLEYGFPSTHSTNAVSAAVYISYMLMSSEDVAQHTGRMVAEALIALYVVSIVVGRLYCGMHGFLDVICGSLLGALFAAIEIIFQSIFDNWLSLNMWAYPFPVITAMLLFIWLHPEPVDDCPCFDDSVAFASVMAGVEVGSWQKRSNQLSDGNLEMLSVNGYSSIRVMTRIALGVLAIFAWRSLVKSILLRFLPPAFRIINRLGIALPRRYFVQATSYYKVPKFIDDGDTIPSISNISSLITLLWRPRKRAVSVGPQSAADAYETIAMIHRKRHISNLLVDKANPSRRESCRNHEDASDGYEGSIDMRTDFVQTYCPEGMAKLTIDEESSTLIASKSETYRKVFSSVRQPRVRYDVEVVTKIIVYFGIGWLAVHGIPTAFEGFGLTLCD